MTETPCINCDKPTRSHEVMANMFLCHECFEGLCDSMINKVAEKVARITREWVKAAMQSLLAGKQIHEAAQRRPKVQSLYDVLKAERLRKLRGN